MDEDQEICRVCRCESTMTKPLYHPCKCTGSIRFIHQDCLLEWLAHSRKDYCELCEHSFIFTPIYRQDMPAQIPIYLVIGECLLRCEASLKIGLRGLVVGIVWLVLLPYMILWSWRFCFSPSVNIDSWNSYETHLTIEHGQHNLSGSSDSHYGVWEFLIDCFKGQMITTGLIIIVAASYIFKEWMAQNILLEADQESDTDQGVPLTENSEYENVDQQIQQPHIDFEDEYVEQQTQHYQTNSENDNDTLSILAEQQKSVDTLLEALKHVGDNDTSAKTEGGNGLKKQLEDLHHDIGQEIKKTQQSNRRQQTHQDRQRDLQQQQQQKHKQQHAHHHPTMTTGGWMNSDFFQLNTDDDDETQVENMMQSIMIQDPAKTPTRYSWDDLLNSSNGTNRNDKQQSLHLKRDSLVSSSLLSNLDNKIPPTFSANDQLLENMLLSRSAVGNDLQCITSMQPTSISIHLQQQRNTNTMDPKSAIPSTSKVENHHTDDNFSRSKLSTTLAYESSLLSPKIQQQRLIFEKGNHHESDVTQQHLHRRQDLDLNNVQHQQTQPIDINNEIFNEEEEEDMEDGIFNLGGDIDGVLEAIGMRGNLWVLLQNSILAFIIISCCLGVAVCIPYLVGRLIIMIRPLRFIEKMIGPLQYVTDPLVDYALDHWCPLVKLDTFLDLFIPAHGVFSSGMLSFLATILNNNDSNISWSSSITSPLPLKDFQFSAPIKSILYGNNNSTTTTAATTKAVSSPHPAILSHQQAQAMTEMKNALHTVSGKIIDRWHQFAVGQSGLDRGVCTIIGYLALLCIGSWYLACQQRTRTTNGRLGVANRMIQQLGIFIKVLSFVILEWVFLPFVCGGLLAMVVMPLVQHWTLTIATPWGCFLHWCVGTCFTYSIAVFLSLCRAMVRPGAMWFIRDTYHPSFQRLRELMDGPFFGLLQNFCTVTLIYVTLIVGGIGSLVWTVLRYTGIQQLQWTFSEPLFSVATDILAAQCLLPILVTSIQPRDAFKYTLSQWWHVMAYQLRLSSFMFGERYPREEGVYVHQTWYTWMISLLVPNNTPDVNDTPTDLIQMDGMLARVPNQDVIKSHLLPKRMIIPVDPSTFEPIDQSDAATNEHNSGELENTTVVYIPPHFTTRVIFFLFSMWVCGSIMVCSVTFGPLLLGRFIFKTWFVSEKELHDLYPYILGACVMTLSTNTIRSAALGTTDYLKQCGGHDGLLIDLLDKLSAYVRQKIVNGCKLLYLIFLIGWLIPLLTGLAVDLYIFAPFRSNHQLALTTLVLSDYWNDGLIYLGIVYRLASILPIATWRREMDQYMSGGLSSLDLWILTRTVLAPWIIVTSSAILIPGGSALILFHLLAVEDASMKLWILQYVYFGVLSMVVILAVVILGMKLLNLLMGVVRDDTYLIGKQLHNLDDPGHKHLNNSTLDGNIKAHIMH